ncbi:Hpt domain-containing protein [Maridesulfovibrio sp.]|uniref:Hpt domain-containing protein n=1 Tax=Maridesulfovibrio sp. TaxID=2795000 RepID=UPI0029CA3192|nr:Hpt domain-containing protein [Maridesulfovibrio sp.]
MNDRIVIPVDEDLEAIMPRYLEIRQRELSELENAVEKKDFETIRLLGHRLKGTGSSYGLDELTRLGTIIEDKALEQELTSISKHTAVIRHFLEHLDIKYVEVDE